LLLGLAHRLELRAFGSREVPDRGAGVDRRALDRRRLASGAILHERDRHDGRSFEHEIVGIAFAGIDDRPHQDDSRFADPSPAVALENRALMQHLDRPRDVGAVSGLRIDVKPT
jgi:hypothetical protein